MRLGRPLVEPSRLTIDEDLMREIENEYAIMVPSADDLRYPVSTFRIRRAIQALINVVKKRQLDLGVEFE